MYPTIESSVAEILSATWDIKNGKVVPETEDIVLKNGGRLLDATYVYADLADSSKLAQTLKKRHLPKSFAHSSIALPASCGTLAEKFVVSTATE